MIPISPLRFINHPLIPKLFMLNLLILLILVAHSRWQLVKKKELAKLAFMKHTLLDISLAIFVIFLLWVLMVIRF